MGQKEYNKFLKKVFSGSSKFIPSSEVCELLIDEFDVSNSYARQIIRRAVKAKVIESSKPISFKQGQYVYFKVGDSLNIDVLEEITKEYRPHLYRLIKILKINNGVLSYYEALKITASPLDGSKTKLSTLEDALSILLKLDIIKIEVDENNIKYIVFTFSSSSQIENVINRHYTDMVLDSMFFSDMLNWLQKINLIDNSNIRFRNKNNPSLGATHNNFVWDAFAYTKTTGINTITKNNKESNDKSVLVVLEVIISREFTIYDLQSFYDRIQVVRNSVNSESNIRKVLPVIIYKQISSEVFNKMQALGFLGFNLGVIYGEKIYEIIDNLNIIKLKENTYLDDTKNFVYVIKETLSSIRSSGQESNLGNIKGDLFESLVYSLFREIFSGGIIRQNKKLPKKDDDDEHYEYDFIIENPRYEERIVVEVKGYNSNKIIKKGPYDKNNTIKWFFNNTLISAKEWLEDDDRNNQPVKASYITTAKFADDAKEYLDDTYVGGNLESNKLDIYYDNQKLLDLIDQEGLDNIRQIIEKYYIKESDTTNNENGLEEGIEVEEIIPPEIDDLFE